MKIKSRESALEDKVEGLLAKIAEQNNRINALIEENLAFELENDALQDRIDEIASLVVAR